MPNYPLTREDAITSYRMPPTNFDLEAACILKTLTGSHMYGTAGEHSDIDVHAIFIAPASYKFGLDRIETLPSSKGDATYYELRFFAKLLLEGQMSALEVLYAPDHALLEIDEIGEQLRENANLFISKDCYHAFKNYAINTARKAIRIDVDSRPHIRAQHQYDVKGAAHAVRIYRMGTELLRTGDLRICRPDDDQELLAIRNGKYSVDEFAVLEEHQEPSGKKRISIVGGMLLEERQRLEEAFVQSPLPDNPDRERINALLVELTTKKLGLHHEAQRVR